MSQPVNRAAADTSRWPFRSARKSLTRRGFMISSETCNSTKGKCTGGTAQTGPALGLNGRLEVEGEAEFLKCRLFFRQVLVPQALEAPLPAELPEEPVDLILQPLVTLAETDGPGFGL